MHVILGGGYMHVLGQDGGGGYMHVLKRAFFPPSLFSFVLDAASPKEMYPSPHMTRMYPPPLTCIYMHVSSSSYDTHVSSSSDMHLHACILLLDLVHATRH